MAYTGRAGCWLAGVGWLVLVGWCWLAGVGWLVLVGWCFWGGLGDYPHGGQHGAGVGRIGPPRGLTR